MDTSIPPSSPLSPAATAEYATPQHDPSRAPAPSHGAVRCESAPGDTPSRGPRMVPMDSVSSLFAAAPQHMARLPSADLLRPAELFLSV